MVQAVEIGALLRVRLQGWGRLGEALAQHEDVPLFVFGGIDGEDVEVEVVRRHRRYLAARVVRVLEPSPHRIEPPCPHFGACTGCQWQHITEEHQRELKRLAVVDALERIGGLDDAPVADIIPAPVPFGYRNHARFTVGPQGALGYVNRESRRFVSIDRCMLMDEAINTTLDQLQGNCADTTQLSVRYGTGTGDVLVQPTLRNPDVPIATGQKHFRERMGGHVFRVGSPSFFQVNTPQAERMVDLIREELELAGDELVADVYAGVGTFAVLLAPHCGHVIAIEESSAAMDDAEVNCEGIPNLELLRARAEDALAEMERCPDAIVLDPPRAGCAPSMLESLVRLRPKKIVYVSCDPSTLARDLKVLCAGGFQLRKVQPIDMFPQTHHVECVATLVAYDTDPATNAAAATLTLASASPRRRQLLQALGMDFRVQPSSVPEEPEPSESPIDLVRRLALAKARAVAADVSEGLVIGADSVVVHQGDILGKPATLEEARGMLARLRGNTHQVFSGVAVVDAATGEHRLASETTPVLMREYSDAEIEDYIGSGSPMDKAGAYGVQDADFHPASSVQGCYSNVVGLPLCTLLDVLREMGYEATPKVPAPLIESCTDCPLQMRESGAWPVRI